MWTAASFTNYTLLYLNKYLEGSIFVNYYVEAAAGIVAILIAYPIYVNCKTLISFVISYSITLLGSIFILLFESDTISPYFVKDAIPPSPHPDGSDEDREYHLRYIIPYLTFVAKVGSGTTFTLAYFVSFSNTTTFPVLRRNTAIGICNFVARLATAFAPLVAELDSPIPIAIIVAVSAVGLAVSLTFPCPSDEMDATPKAEEKDGDQ